MLYRVFKGWDTGGNPIWEWACCCEQCRTKTSLCLDLSMAISEEMRANYTIRLEPTLFYSAPYNFIQGNHYG